MNFKDINSLNFEEAAQELELIASKLEEAKIDLDQAISLFERGSALKQFCDTKLNSAKLRVEKIIEENNKIIRTETTELEGQYTKS